MGRQRRWDGRQIIRKVQSIKKNWMKAFHEKYTSLTSGFEKRYQEQLKGMEQALKLQGVKLPKGRDAKYDPPVPRPTYKPDRASPAYRKFSPITRNMAGKILQLGPTVNPTIYQTALIAANGTTDPQVKESELIDHMRNYFDISMSHSQEVRKYGGGVRGMMKSVEHAFSLGDTVGRGGVQASLQQARGLSEGAEWLEKVITSQFGQKVAAAMGERMFAGAADSAARGVSAVFSAGRILRSVSAIATVAKIGLDVATAQAEQGKKTAYMQAEARGAGIDYGDPAVAAVHFREMQHLQSRGRTVFRRIQDWAGFTEKSAGEARAMYSQQLGLMRKLGDDPALLGGTMAGALVSYSRQTGTPVALMTAMEKRRALDEAATAQLKQFMDDPANERETRFNNPWLQVEENPIGMVFQWMADFKPDHNLAPLFARLAKIKGGHLPWVTDKSLKAQWGIAARETAEKRITGKDQYAEQSPERLRAVTEQQYTMWLIAKGPILRAQLERERIEAELRNKAMSKRRQVESYD